MENKARRIAKRFKQGETVNFLKAECFYNLKRINILEISSRSYSQHWWKNLMIEVMTSFFYKFFDKML